MLVLSRKVGEQICVPKFGVVLTVLAVRGGRIRIGITAPKEMAIVREELLRCEQKLPGTRLLQGPMRRTP